jgi:hypothetical protein
MPLLKFWKSNRDEVLNLSVEQVMSNAGDGDLKDASECCNELRQFLAVAPRVTVPGTCEKIEFGPLFNRVTY